MIPYILIFFMSSGSNSVPTIPVVVATYDSKDQCVAALEVWKKGPPMWVYILHSGLCIPGPRS